MILKKLILISIIFSLFCCMDFSFAQTVNYLKSMKYKLNKKCISFINEINDLYKTEIFIKEKDLEDSEHGWSYMEKDIPVIEINIKAKYKEEILIHEAYHHKLRYEGFPNIGFEFPKNNKSSSNKTYLKWFTHLFWDKISHYYFYPLMLNELKINPYKSTSFEMKEIIKNGQIDGLKDATREIGLAGKYLQVWVETQNDKLLKEFKDFLINKYNGQGIELGEELINIFKKKQIKDSNDALRLFVECFNLIHKKQNIKIGDPIIEKEIHNNYIQNYADFKIIPI